MIFQTNAGQNVIKYSRFGDFLIKSETKERKKGATAMTVRRMLWQAGRRAGRQGITAPFLGKLNILFAADNRRI